MRGLRLPLAFLQLARAAGARVSLRARAVSLCAVFVLPAVAPDTARADVYAEEDRSFGVEPPAGYRAKDYHAPTPDAVAGARVVTTG